MPRNDLSSLARMVRILRPRGTLAFLSAWLLPWRPAFRVRATQSKLSFFVHRRDLLGRHLAKYGSHEPLLTRLIGAYLANCARGIFVDVGANLGWHAIHAARHNAVETVIAFEPEPFNAWLLDRNLSLNNVDNVIVSTCAVGAGCGSIRLHKYKDSNRGRHSVLTDFGYGSRVVPMTDLDTALDSLGLGAEPVLMLKIDVEGYEPEVVAGATRTLARADAVVMEYSPGLGRAGGLSAEAMLDRLCAAGFFPYRLEDRDWTAERPVGNRGFEGQMDLIWVRAGKERMFANGSSAGPLLPTDKARLRQITEIWRRMAQQAAGQPAQASSKPICGSSSRGA